MKRERCKKCEMHKKAEKRRAAKIRTKISIITNSNTVNSHDYRISLSRISRTNRSLLTGHSVHCQYQLAICPSGDQCWSVAWTLP